MARIEVIVGALCLAASCVNAEYRLIVDDRAAFEACLQVNPLSTITDSAGDFAPDPAVDSGLASVHRSGTVDGSGFAYDVYDIDFATAPVGWLAPGVSGGDIFDLDTLDVEAPVTQDEATGQGSWGVDSNVGNTNSCNAALFDFTTTPSGAGIAHFGVDLHDFESSPSFTLGRLRLYDGGAIVYSRYILWPDDGNGTSHFIGVVADALSSQFDQVVLIVGDDGPGSGFLERWAADRFTFGQARTNPICVGDMDGDGVRDLTDFTWFAAAYGSVIGGNNYAPSADLDGDGVIDLTDFTAFAQVYGVPCPQ